MKTHLSAFAAFALTLAALSAAVAGDPPEPATISTSGSAELHVPADLADLSFEVNVRQADLAIARKKQSERATKVLAALRDAGVEEKDLQTTQVNVTPTYAENRRGETTVINYYDVTQSIFCTLHDVKKVAEVTTAVLAAGATTVGEANLRTSQIRKYRDDARSQAARAAREKAVAIATELGAKVGKPYKVVEGGDTILRANSSNYAESAGGLRSAAKPASYAAESAPAVFAPGLLTISAELNVTFYLE